jgi:hypothetical protein
VLVAERPWGFESLRPHHDGFMLPGSCWLRGSHGQPRTPDAAPTTLPGEARDLGLTRRLPAPYRRVCAEQADYAPAGARLCPPLVPEGPVKVMSTGPFSKSPRDRGGYLADFSSSSLSRLGAEHIETNLGHWHYDVSWTPATRRLLVRRFVERPHNSSKASACRHLRLRVDPRPGELRPIAPRVRQQTKGPGHDTRADNAGSGRLELGLVRPSALECRARARCDGRPCSNCRIPWGWRMTV